MFQFVQLGPYLIGTALPRDKMFKLAHYVARTVVKRMVDIRHEMPSCFNPCSFSHVFSKSIKILNVKLSFHSREKMYS